METMSVHPPWYKGLSPELEKYAELSIGETPEIRKKALKEFRKLIKEQKHINSRDDDVFLLRFLRTKKFDVPKSIHLFRSYYKFLEKQKNIFTRKKPSDLKRFINMNFTLVMPYYLPSGSPLGITRIGCFDVNIGTQQDMVSVLLLVGELLLELESAQVCGVTRVVDFSGLTLRHYRQFVTAPFLSLVINTVQDCWPERMNAIHFVHEPTIIHAIGTVVKPILKTKMKERIHFHGNDLESLHQYIPKDFLPEELGGTTGPFNCTDFASFVYSHESFFESLNKFGVIEN